MRNHPQQEQAVPMTATAPQMIYVETDLPAGMTLAEWRRRDRGVVLARKHRRSLRERVLGLPLAPRPKFA